MTVLLLAACLPSRGEAAEPFVESDHALVGNQQEQIRALEEQLRVLDEKQARLWATLSAEPPLFEEGSDDGSLLLSDETEEESELEQLSYTTENLVPPAPGIDGVPAAQPKPRFAKKAAPKPAYPTVKLTGMFQLDLGVIDQDDVNRATVGDVDNGLGFRRIRFGATGNITEDTTYQVEFDFAQSQPRFADMWVDFDTHGAVGHLRIGRFRQPFGMDALNGIRELPFLERPLPFALAPFRQTGLMLYNTEFDENMTWQVSGYRYLSDNFGNVYGDDGGLGMAARTTLLPYYYNDGEELIHVGFAYSHNDPARNLVQFQFQPEYFVGQNPNLGPAGLDFLPMVNVPPFVNTGAMPTEHTNLFNVEAGAACGRLYLQSEARWAVVDLLNGTQETFPGAYAEARYVLTGEKLPYNRQWGVFGRIVPDEPFRFCAGGVGAWELAARWSYLDLNGTALPGPGRNLNDVTVGLNWYLNKFAKFQFNYINAMLDDPTLGDSEAHIFAARTQVDF